MESMESVDEDTRRYGVVRQAAKGDTGILSILSSQFDLLESFDIESDPCSPDALRKLLDTHRLDAICHVPSDIDEVTPMVLTKLLWCALSAKANGRPVTSFGLLADGSLWNPMDAGGGDAADNAGPTRSPAGFPVALSRGRAEEVVGTDSDAFVVRECLWRHSVDGLNDVPPKRHPASVGWRFRRFGGVPRHWRFSYRRENARGPMPLRAPGGKRLLHIAPFLDIGGADKFSLDVADQLLKNHDVETVFVLSDVSANRWVERAREVGGEVHVLGEFLDYNQYSSFIESLLGSGEFLGVLLMHSFWGYRLAPFLRKRFPRLPLIDYLHIEHEDWRDGGYPRFSLDYRESISHTLVSSRHLMGWLRDQGMPADRVSVCTTNIDGNLWNPGRFDPAAIRADYGIGDDTCLILFAGRLAPQKQPMVLAETLMRLERDGLAFQALIAGDGNDQPLVERVIEQHALKQSRLIGPATNEEIMRLMAAADIFFLPSEMEGIALALFEAMAMECLFVGAAVGGQAEVATPDVACLIERAGRDVEDYHRILSQMIPEPGRRRAMGRRARQRILDHYSIDRLGREVLGALEARAAEGTPGPPPAWAAILADELQSHEDYVSGEWQEDGYITELRGYISQLHHWIERKDDQMAREIERRDHYKQVAREEKNKRRGLEQQLDGARKRLRKARNPISRLLGRF